MEGKGSQKSEGGTGPASEKKIRKRSPWKKRIWGGLLGLVVIFSLAVTLAEKSGQGPLPTWKEIYEFFGVVDVDETQAPVHVRILDVGAADSILISGEECHILIDAGTSAQGDKIVRDMEKLGVSHLDLVIATHPHADHIGGMERVLRSVAVDKLVMPEPPDSLIPTTPSYLGMLEAIEEREIPSISAQAGQQFQFGDLRLEILHAGTRQDSTDNLNDLSVVVRMTYGDVSFLFMGDSEEETEQEILQSGVECRADVLKLGHHGSNTSTTPAFLSAVSPSAAAISCGQHAPPGDRVLELLRKREISYYRTDLDGRITFATDGKTIDTMLEK